MYEGFWQLVFEIIFIVVYFYKFETMLLLNVIFFFRYIIGGKDLAETIFLRL